METIKIYLDNMFRNLPKTDEMIHLKNEIQANMEDKYNELKAEGKLENEAVGIVISEFGNIDELLEEMNIAPAEPSDSYRTISLDEAKEFITLKKSSAYLIGLGVGLILFGVSLMIFLSQMATGGLILEGTPENAQHAVPVIMLFLFIAPAVGLFIYSGAKLERFKFIEQGEFELTASTKVLLNSERMPVDAKRNVGVIIGVCLCVLSPLAIFVGTLFGGNFSAYGVSVLLIIIAVAVFIFITTGSSSESYKKLLKLGEFNPVMQKEDKIIGAIASIIWPLAVCIFLFSGFVFGLWHIAWVVFPLTGILFGGFCAFYKAMKSN